MVKKDYSGWSREELVREIVKLGKRKKYGVVWEDKAEEVAELCKEKLPVLSEYKKLKIQTDSKKGVNILIEGDNYHALSVLNYTHHGKIDVIYIDPPYNTGARDWKYNNDYVDINDLWRHSKWLSFMEKRLKLAKNLLKRTGVLICTIDDNEHAALGLLLQEVFQKREIVCVTIVHNPSGIQGKNFSPCHEYAFFVYPKGGRFINMQDREEDPDIRPLRNVSKGEHLRATAKNCFYPIFVKKGKVIGFGDVSADSFHPKSANIIRKDGVIEVYPIDAQGNERKWVFARQSVESIKDELTVEYNKKRHFYDIIRKKTKFNYKTVWDDEKYNANVYGTQLLSNIIKNRFPFPKSLYAVMECVRAAVHDKDDSIILDYFAGSGTTGHAVLELNEKDKGKRKFILCTNNEDNDGDGVRIASDICYPRMKNIMTGYKGVLDGKRYEGLGGNLMYFRTDFVDAETTDLNKKKLVDKSTEMLCLREDCFEEVNRGENFRVFTNNNERNLGIIYDDDGIEPFKKEVRKSKKKFVVYVFSLDESAREEEFEDMKDYVELKPIPAIILNVYKRIFK